MSIKLTARIHKLLTPYVVLSLASLFWSGNFIVGRALRDVAMPLTLNFWRWLIALLILAPVCVPYIINQRALVLGSWRLIILLGLTGIAAFHLCVYQALHDTTAINALLFLSLTPVTIVLGSWLVYRDPVSRHQGVGIIMSLSGAVVIISQGEWARLLNLQFNRGDLWMLGAMLFWAIYSVALKNKPAQLAQQSMLGATVAVGVVAMAPVYVITGQSGAALFTSGGSVVAGLIYISVFSSVLAYFFWNRGVDVIGPNKAGVFLHLMPLFGALLSWTLLGEGLQFYHVPGGLLIFSGIMLSYRASRMELR